MYSFNSDYFTVTRKDINDFKINHRYDDTQYRTFLNRGLFLNDINIAKFLIEHRINCLISSLTIKDWVKWRKRRSLKKLDKIIKIEKQHKDAVFKKVKFLGFVFYQGLCEYIPNAFLKDVEISS